MRYGVFAALAASPFVGSFMGVLIRRMSEGRDWVRARSRCEHCSRVLAPMELVPIASYAVLRGKCAGCGTAIGWFHPAIELAAVAVAALVVAVAGSEPQHLWPGCVLGWSCLTLAIIDWRSFRLPDILTLPLVLAGLLATWWNSAAQGDASFASPVSPALADHALAAALGWLAFRTIGWLYWRLRGIDGLGQGDAKLLAAAGAWVGTQILPFVVCIAAILTLLAVLACSIRLWQKPRRDRHIAFGPALAASLFGCWLALA